MYGDLLNYFRENRSVDPDHDIGNLVLLDAATNRSYKNAFFSIKRRHVLGLERRGIFVPLGTKNVFLKAYSKSIRHMMFWSESDNLGYIKAIVDMLTGFFRPERGTAK